MTNIAFNGYEFAADSRVTVKVASETGDGSRTVKSRTDGREKIFIFTVPDPNLELKYHNAAIGRSHFNPQYATFRNQYVAAVARSGHVYLTKPLIQALMKGKNIEEFYLTNLRFSEKTVGRACSLIIVTVTQSWLLKITKSGTLSVKEIPPGEPLAIGDGHAQAMWLMKHWGFSPTEAVMAVATSTDKCNWPVMSYVRCGWEGGRWKANGQTGCVEEEGGELRKFTDEEARAWVAKAAIRRMRLIQADIEHQTPYDKDSNVQMQGAIDQLMQALRVVVK